MHQPLVRHFQSSTPVPRRIVFVLTSPLDCDLLTEWCKRRVNCDTVAGLYCVTEGLELCRRLRPGLMVLDPAAGEDAIARSVAALSQQQMNYLLVLDRRPLESRLLDILDEPAASYLSRMAGEHALAAAIDDILTHGRRVFDPALAPRIRQTGNGYEYVGLPSDKSVGSLSARERQVIRLLAEGRSVQQCATEMGLSHSTIDNHKTRLMKKLGLHKASELTCWAVREGLIVC